MVERSVRHLRQHQVALSDLLGDVMAGVGRGKGGGQSAGKEGGQLHFGGMKRVDVVDVDDEFGCIVPGYVSPLYTRVDTE